jgi:hypothetical protein
MIIAVRVLISYMWSSLLVALAPPGINRRRCRVTNEQYFMPVYIYTYMYITIVPGVRGMGLESKL